MSEASIIELEGDFSDRRKRVDRYKGALLDTNLNRDEISDSIKHEFIGTEGSAFVRDVLNAHTQVTQFLAEITCGGECRPGMTLPGVEMGMFLTFQWLTSSMEALEDLEDARAQLRKAAE